MKTRTLTGILCLAFALLCSITAKSQNDCKNCTTTSKAPKPTVTALPKEAIDYTVLADEDNVHPSDGSFQIVSLLADNKIENITIDYIQSLVQSNRKENEDVTLELTKFTKVRILSNSKIKSANFKAYTELYTFE